MTGAGADYIALAICLVATLTDLRARRIPNLLTYPAILLGIAWHHDLAVVASVAVAAAVFGPVYWLKGVGGGDLKLALAVAALIGRYDATLNVLIYTTLAGAVLALADAARQGKLGVLWRRLRSRQARQSTPPLTIPYAPAFLLGTLVYLLLP